VKKSDGFEADTGQKPPQAPVLPPPPAALPVPRGGVLAALHEAQDPGVYFQDHSRKEDHREEAEDPELAAAVEDTIRLLFGVRGIHHVAPGENQAHEPVVLIAADRGFTEGSLAAIPEKVGRFPTLVVVPYELLPLRRS